MRRSRIVGVMAAILLIATPALAQEYADEAGDLDIEPTIVITVEVAGEGFVAESVVYVTAIGPGGTELDLGTLPTDDQGRFFGEIVLPDGLPVGNYTITATGVTAQGATRILSAPISLGASVAAPALDQVDDPTIRDLIPDADLVAGRSSTTLSDVDPQLAVRVLTRLLGDVWMWFAGGARR